MKRSTAKAKRIQVAVIESDPLRAIGFRALLESEADLEFVPATSVEALMQQNLGVVLLANRHGHNLVSQMSSLKERRPDLPVIVIGSSTDDEAILSAIGCGAKGHVFDGAPPCEFAQAIRTVYLGSIWASRRVLSKFIERASTRRKGAVPGGFGPITRREKEVLKMLVAGLSNKEIGVPLGIEERTVKAHIAKMMRKVGVQNRIALCVHALTNSLVSRQPLQPPSTTEEFQ
jgi:DNA-binding NarL/FixJ family response regulator